MAVYVFTVNLLIYLLPAPGCPRGYTGAGGISDGGLHHNCSGGIAAFVDRKLFGTSHLYRYGGFRNLYFPNDQEHAPLVDPEGLFGK